MKSCSWWCFPPRALPRSTTPSPATAPHDSFPPEEKDSSLMPHLPLFRFPASGSFPSSTACARTRGPLATIFDTILRNRLAPSANVPERADAMRIGCLARRGQEYLELGTKRQPSGPPRYQTNRLRGFLTPLGHETASVNYRPHGQIKAK